MNSVVLDVAIGMAFLYLLLSLIASVLQELLATFMQLRPANLQRAIHSLLTGNSIQSGMDLVDSIYNHGLVRGLYSDPKWDQNPDRQKMKDEEAEEPKTGFVAWSKRVWAYLSGRPLDPLRQLLRRLIGIKPDKNVHCVSSQLLLPAYIPADTFALAMVDLLNRNKTMGPAAMTEIRDFLAAHHYEFRDNKATEAMLALATDAQGDLKKFQQSLQSWYSASMDRASGWYKKYTQQMLLIIGLILAVTFNVDSLRVAQTLWTDRDVRQAMDSAATDYLSKQPKPATATAPAAPAPAAQPEDFNALETKLQGTVTTFQQVTTQTLLPVGWAQGRHPLSARFQLLRDQPRLAIRRGWQLLWRTKTMVMLLGWIFTGVAISLGAPFWFDTLNKFMVVRSTVKPQEKSQDEPSKS